MSITQITASETVLAHELADAQDAVKQIAHERDKYRNEVDALKTLYGETPLESFRIIDKLRACGAAEYKRGIEDAWRCCETRWDGTVEDCMKAIRKLGEVK